MGREERQDQAVIHSSSIALLQERFRQLQKVKEMREEKELMRLLNFNTSYCMVYQDQPPASPAAVARFFFHPDPELMMVTTMLPPTPTTTTTTSPRHLTSLSLWPTSQNKFSDYNYGRDGGKGGVDVPNLMNLWPVASAASDTSNVTYSTISLNKLDDDDDDFDSDIDTSLHL